MSCNPAIGGIGKGHLVKEIDAMGGSMARAIDLSGIQFRTLNASKGPAVRATRAQEDRLLYKAEIRNIVENQENLSIAFFFFLSVAFFGELFGDVFCSQADFTCSKFSRVCLRRFFRLDSLSSKPNINPR